MQRVCDDRSCVIHEVPELETQVGIRNREAVFDMSNDFTHDLERRVIDQEHIDADFGPQAGLD